MIGLSRCSTPKNVTADDRTVVHRRVDHRRPNEGMLMSIVVQALEAHSTVSLGLALIDFE